MEHVLIYLPASLNLLQRFPIKLMTSVQYEHWMEPVFLHPNQGHLFKNFVIVFHIHRFWFSSIETSFCCRKSKVSKELICFALTTTRFKNDLLSKCMKQKSSQVTWGNWTPLGLVGRPADRVWEIQRSMACRKNLWSTICGTLSDVTLETLHLSFDKTVRRVLSFALDISTSPIQNLI